MKWGDYDPLFEKCWAICAYLGVWGRRGTHLGKGGMGVGLGRRARNECHIWDIITLLDHNSVVQITGDRDDTKS